MLYKITNLTGLQAKFATLFSLFALFSNFLVLLGVTYAFIVADFYFGYRLSKKVKKINSNAIASGKLESCKWWHTIIKGKDAAIFIALAFLADKYIFHSGDLICSLTVTGFVCGAEFWSMLENYAYISDAKWAKWLRKYVKNKAEKHLGFNISENE